MKPTEPWTTTPWPDCHWSENTTRSRYTNGLDPMETTLAITRWLTLTGLAVAATALLAGIRVWRAWAAPVETGD